MITYIKGDATNPIGDGHKYLCHIVNDVYAWGAGFVLAIDKKFPGAKADYLSRDKLTLGNIYIYQQDDISDVGVVHMCAQKGLRSRYNPRPVDYVALRDCLIKVKFLVGAPNTSVHMPKIGAGLGGGKWSVISLIIEEVFKDKEVFVYEL